SGWVATGREFAARTVVREGGDMSRENGRQHFVAGALVLAWVGVAAGIQPPPSSPTMHGDAELTSVFFLDADRGWAVGDRGVIWHTVDGGRAWRQQPSPVHCRLESVQFLSSELGWAVGGFT